MCLKSWCALIALLWFTGVSLAGNAIVPTTTLALVTSNNTSTANGFSAQTNGNAAASNISKVDIHSLLYPGATTKIYAHLLLWFGGSKHMNVGYSSTDAQQVHRQITDMISRGIDGVIIDWYGPNNSEDQATKLVMTEAEAHPGFTFAIVVDQGALRWNSCSGCSPQQALDEQLQYVEQTYFPSPAYMTLGGRPVVTNFNIDQSYAINWDEVSASLATQPAFLFQNNVGFTHVLSEGSYSWVMPTVSDYGLGYLQSFYDTGMALGNEQTVGAAYKGFNDTLASWGSNRIMGQQCGETWLETFSEINQLYNSGRQLPALQLVTWNDYEEGTEIESGINNCLSISPSVSGNSLQWAVTGDENTVDHYQAYVSTDGTNLMSLAQLAPGTRALDLCSYSLANGNYTLYVQAIGKPSVTNQMSSAVKMNLVCGTATTTTTASGLTLGASPTSIAITTGGSGILTVSVTPQGGSFDSAVALACPGLPTNLQCSFAPTSIIPGGSTATSTLTISAASALGTSTHHQGTTLLGAEWLFGFGLFGAVFLGKMEGRRSRRILTLGLMTVSIFGAISCGGHSSSTVPTNTIANSYVVQIQGSAGSVQTSTAITVTVK
jgi:hypothetical protein